MKLLYDCHMYNLKAGDDIQAKYESTSENLLRYGEILTDDGDLYDIEWCEPNNSYRLRTIAYNGHVYYHKMINGEVIEIKELK